VIMKRIALFIISFLLLVSCACNRDGRHIITPEELKKLEKCSRIERRVTDVFSKKMYITKGLVTIGTGGGGVGKIKTIDVSFECYQEMNISQARKLLLECVGGFLVEINKTPELKQYSREFPFTFKNVNISIIFISIKTRNFIYSPLIASARIDEGNIMYNIYHDEQLDTIKEETYEEALKIVEQESKSPDA